MLRAALIGLPSSGKTTLFQLMTSAKEAPRGKGDVNIGISKVPDDRLDILTGMYNPKKRVPATVEFTDILCTHCRSLVGSMERLREAVPPGSVSVEARHFPLDSECNRLARHSDGRGLRCLGAKAQICLEQAPDYWELRGKMFAAQEDLTRETLLGIASSGTVNFSQVFVFPLRTSASAFSMKCSAHAAE